MLVFPFNRLAHYLRCLTLAKFLKPYFEIRFADSEEYRQFVINDGLSTFPCKSLDADKVMEKARHFDFSWMNEEDMEPVLASQVEAINHYKPQFVLGDTCFTLKMAAEQTGVFYIGLMNGYMSKFYKPLRKLPSTHPAYKYLQLLHPKAARLMTTIGEIAAFRKIHKPFKNIRKRHGLKKLNTYPDEMEGDLTLLCDLSELFPQNPLPPNYCWIPPLIYRSGPQHSASIEKQLDPDKKTILVTMGSTGNWKKMTFLNEDYFKKYNLVIAGDNTGAVTAAHAIHLPFISLHELLPFTDLVLCHGGNGTAYLALLYGAPLLCMADHFEQEWNVDQLEKAGLGGDLEGKDAMKIVAMVGEWVDRKNRGEHLVFKGKMQMANEQIQKMILKLLNSI